MSRPKKSGDKAPHSKTLSREFNRAIVSTLFTNIQHLTSLPPEANMMSDVTVHSLQNLQNEVQYGDNGTFLIDEPASVGGDGVGPDPYTMLLGALGGCISMTVTLYARQKRWPLERVTVRLRQQRVHARDCEECSESKEGFVHRIERTVSVEGNLSDEQRARLQEIAHKCPVHKTLTSEIFVTEMTG